jgi:hypothetical protein
MEKRELKKGRGGDWSKLFNSLGAEKKSRLKVLLISYVWTICGRRGMTLCQKR